MVASLLYLLRMNQQELIQKIKPILERHHIIKAELFGSYARGDETSESDVDILVQLGKPMGFDYFGMADEIEEAVGKSVDVITYKYVYPPLRPYIFAHTIRIL